MKIIKRTDIPTWQDILIRIIAVLCALLATAMVMTMFGYNFIEIYAKMVEGSIGTAYRFKETINKTIPLIVLSLGISVAFKMKFWNIGAEGQFYMGAWASTYFALFYPNLPGFLLIPIMIIASIIVGGLWALIPAFLKYKLSTSETLVTLMMNYIAICLVSYFQHGPWKDPGAMGLPKIANFPQNAILPKIFDVHMGWVIVVALVVIIYFIMKKTKLGYEISILGESEKTAKYIGMNIIKILVISILISGGLCGLAGMMQSSAIEKSLSDQMSGGMGFTAIIISWLARLSPPIIVIVAFLFAILIQGGAYLQTSLQISSAVAGILQGVILFFVLGSEFFTQYKICFIQTTTKLYTAKGAGK